MNKIGRNEAKMEVQQATGDEMALLAAVEAMEKQAMEQKAGTIQQKVPTLRFEMGPKEDPLPFRVPSPSTEVIPPEVPITSKPVEDLHDQHQHEIDVQAMQTLAYPENAAFPKRNYQHSIIQQCIHKNTLVSLPTGLGKCLGPATEVMRFNGQICYANEIKQGDLLMGPNQMGKVCIATYSGRGMMYRIKNDRGNTYHTNGPHKMVLRLRCHYDPRDPLSVEIAYQGGSDAIYVKKVQCRDRDQLDHYIERYQDNGRVILPVYTLYHSFHRGKGIVTLPQSITCEYDQPVPPPSYVSIYYWIGILYARVHHLRGKVCSPMKENMPTYLKRYWKGWVGIAGNILAISSHIGCQWVMKGILSVTGSHFRSDSMHTLRMIERFSQRVGYTCWYPSMYEVVLHENHVTGIEIEEVGEGPYCGFELRDYYGPGHDYSKAPRGDESGLFLLGHGEVSHNTFIAAVVMLNYYRWFPQSKIAFMAPNKPLVRQQIEACSNITGIPADSYCELTGAMSSAKRRPLWTEKRVFFMTPQIFRNDLKAGHVQPEDYCLVVFDEAHKARGQHAYCETISLMLEKSREFRVVGLSATPGSDPSRIQQTITKLLISHIEVRTRQSIDVREYVHRVHVKVVTVPASDTQTRIFGLIDGLARQPLRVLRDSNAFHTGADGMKGVTQGSIVMARKRHGDATHHYDHRVNIAFAAVACLSHMSEVIWTQTLSGFLSYVNERRNQGNKKKDAFLTSSDMMRACAVARVALEADIGQNSPKLPVVLGIIREHKAKAVAAGKQNFRTMIFADLRATVASICEYIEREEGDHMKAHAFIGQAASKTGVGQTQVVQKRIMEQFKSGVFDILVSTSIGEEGLDVPDLDLIICFDAKTDPTRLVQRTGRTGRKQAGNCVIIVSEGMEEQMYRRSVHRSNAVNNSLAMMKTFSLYQYNPSMLPKRHHPQYDPIEVHAEPFQAMEGRSVDPMKKLYGVSSANAVIGNRVRLLADQVDAQEVLMRNVEAQQRLQRVGKYTHTSLSELFVNVIQLSVDMREGLLPGYWEKISFQGNPMIPEAYWDAEPQKPLPAVSYRYVPETIYSQPAVIVEEEKSAEIFLDSDEEDSLFAGLSPPQTSTVNEVDLQSFLHMKPPPTSTPARQPSLNTTIVNLLASSEEEFMD